MIVDTPKKAVRATVKYQTLRNLLDLNRFDCRRYLLAIEAVSLGVLLFAPLLL